MKIPEPELAPMMEEMGAKLPDIVNTETGFVRKCGKCHDPCELKWYPEMPEMDMEEKMAMNMRKLSQFVTAKIMLMYLNYPSFLHSLHGSHGQEDVQEDEGIKIYG